MFLTSAKPTIRFAAVKTLNRIAMIHPDAVTSCNVDLENLISDSNRSIATLAITTLLKVSDGVHQLEIVPAIECIARTKGLIGYIKHVQCIHTYMYGMHNMYMHITTRAHKHTQDW